MVVGVSGGPDSMCLLDMLHALVPEFDLELIVAHFNHGLRPRDDEKETRFVAETARTRDLTFTTEKADLLLNARRGSLEERARQARYAFFESIRDAHRAQKIALGHTLNDQAETVLMRLLRGSGSAGLAGIPPVRGNTIIRPLIDLTRSEIASYLQHKHLTYVVDPTNRDVTFMRNNIRWRLLPMLETFQPRIVPMLGQMANIMRRNETWQMSEARAWLKAHATIKKHERIDLPLGPFRMLPAAMHPQVIRCALNMVAGHLRRIGFRHLDAMARMVQGTRPQARMNLPHHWVCIRDYDRLVFCRQPPKKLERYSYEINGPGIFPLEALGATLTLEALPREALRSYGASPWTACLDGDRLSYPLTIRNYQTGDRFIPLGMRGHKKLQDFFVDLKIPSDLRKRAPVLICQDKVVWVCGLRIDDRFKVTPKTETILKVEFKKS